MNILQISTKVPYPPKDGGASGIYVFSKALAELGHKVTIFAANPQKHYVSEGIISKIHQNITIIALDINTNIRIVAALYNLIFSLIPYHVSRFYNSYFRKRLKELLKENEFDIIQFEGIYMGLYLKTIRSSI